MKKDEPSEYEGGGRKGLFVHNRRHRVTSPSYAKRRVDEDRRNGEQSRSDYSNRIARRDVTRRIVNRFEASTMTPDSVDALRRELLCSLDTGLVNTLASTECAAPIHGSTTLDEIERATPAELPDIMRKVSTRMPRESYTALTLPGGKKRARLWLLAILAFGACGLATGHSASTGNAYETCERIYVEDTSQDHVLGCISRDNPSRLRGCYYNHIAPGVNTPDCRSDTERRFRYDYYPMAAVRSGDLYFPSSEDASSHREKQRKSVPDAGVHEFTRECDNSRTCTGFMTTRRVPDMFGNTDDPRYPGYETLNVDQDPSVCDGPGNPNYPRRHGAPSMTRYFKKQWNCTRPPQPDAFTKQHAPNDSDVKSTKDNDDPLAKEKAAKTKADKLAKEKAEQLAKEKAEKLAKEKAAKTKADKLAKEKAAKEKAEKQEHDIDSLRYKFVDCNTLKRDYHRDSLHRHPDKGGSDESFIQLTRAFDQMWRKNQCRL